MKAVWPGAWRHFGCGGCISVAVLGGSGPLMNVLQLHAQFHVATQQVPACNFAYGITRLAKAQTQYDGASSPVAISRQVPGGKVGPFDALTHLLVVHRVRAVAELHRPSYWLLPCAVPNGLGNERARE